jgi:hypothetical protein
MVHDNRSKKSGSFLNGCISDVKAVEEELSCL